MTAPNEKAAPIPAKVRQRLIESGADSVALALAKGVTERIGRSDWSLLTNLIHCAIIDGAAILADREARPSLPDSREEREALALTDGDLPALPYSDPEGAFSANQMRWYARTAVMADRARARQGGNNG